MLETIGLQPNQERCRGHPCIRFFTFLIHSLYVRTVLRMGSVRGEEGPGFARRQAPWERICGLPALLRSWESSNVSRNVVLGRDLEPRDASTSPIPEHLPASVASALTKRGIDRLFAHQVRALALAEEGRDFVVATPTASGKSLCYNLPVLRELTADPTARALYLFPTKALCRDQEEALRALLRDADLGHAGITYDGDTPADARRAAREKAGLLLTNPDMLHAGILPHHTLWARFFANLRYVVIDELHSYRGVFGSHLANVIRRLQRVARFHGSDPVFLFSSATIGNPREHASRLCGREVELIDENGAPTGPRRLIVYNPPIVNAELGIRASYLKTAVKLAHDLVRAQVSTLVFGQSRNAVEVMLKYLRDRVVRDHIDPETIQAYRGGYLPQTRRRIEKRLRSGEIQCVVATNALELGIDIGSLEAVVCAGYPGTVAGLWQRFGRAGRRVGPSLAVLVTSSNPIDQYMAHHAHQLVGASIEHARIDPDNIEILLQHLKCATFELPFEPGDRYGDLPVESVEDALTYLAGTNLVHPVARADRGTVYHWAAESYPASDVSLRRATPDNFVIIELSENRTIAEMDWHSTHTMLHEQAIYQHEGDQYQVERLDFENHKAYVRKVEPDYYTTAMTYTKVAVLEQDERARLEHGGVAGQAPGHTSHCSAVPPVKNAVALDTGLGEINVSERVVGFKKIKFHTHENVGWGEVDLPEMEMETTSFWLTVPEDFVRGWAEPRPVVIDALRGLSKALHIIAAVGLMIDPRDLGRTLGDRHDPDEPPGKGHGPGFDPTIFLYDQTPGGVGLAPRIFEERHTLLRRARQLIERCECEEGCPACVGPVVGSELPGSEAIDAPLSGSRKALVLDILDAFGVDTVH